MLFGVVCCNATSALQQFISRLENRGADDSARENLPAVLLEQACPGGLASVARSV